MLRCRRCGGDHFISTQSIPNLPSGHPSASAEKGPEPILHVSWERGCAIGAMVIMFIDDEKLLGVSQCPEHLVTLGNSITFLTRK